jgi:hypothetical protein
MTLQEIIDQARYRLNNYEKPYLWVDSELVYYANQIENIIARETRSLVDTTTDSICRIFTSAGVLDYALSPLILYVLSAKLVETELMTLDVAPTPTTFAAAATVTGVTSSKACTVVSKDTSTTYTVEHRTGTFTLGEVVGDGTNTADQGATYPTFSDNSDSPKFLTKTNTASMDGIVSWRSADQNEPARFVLDYRTGYLTVYPPPDDSYPIYLSVIRYPLTALTTSSMSAQTPEIDQAYHSAIVDGICYMARLKAGEHTFDPVQSDLYFRIFRNAIAVQKIHGNLYTGWDSAGPLGGFI